MPKFEVTIEHRVLEYIKVTVDAPTAVAAEAQVSAVFVACAYDANDVVEHYETESRLQSWELKESDTGDLTVTRVEQVHHALHA